MTSTRARVYTAGPAVFFPDLAERIAASHRNADAHGLVAIVPGDVLDRPVDFPPQPTMQDIYRLNVDRLLRSDAVVADLTPFRGPSADPGTVWEIGFAVALGKPVFGYTEDLREYREKVAPDGLRVEDHGAVDNLMIAASVESVVAGQDDAMAAVAKWWASRG
ncbi:nucleoside 2-deoxyribosyltransferase [Conyzicola lurida]|uniref:Nucleoside 2-deoxyribosyltransferase n=1 Tax=Conyzicola lurida TaxID=1172621 RepID=A0A841AP29_9MICO|nr:nucleoside 2-deoxyribosyltransferase [Conyzicola lurida]